MTLPGLTTGERSRNRKHGGEDAVARRLMLRFSAVSAALMLVLGVGVLTRVADATVLLHVPFEAQAQTASRVFVGQVASVASRPCAARPAYFETIVAFTVEEVVAGGVPSSVELRFSGGQVGDIRQSIDGMPEFTAGERYVVFLQPDQDPPLISPIVGFNQGLYQVVTNAAGEDVVRDRRGRRLQAAGTTARAAVTAEPRLHEFTAAVEAARP